MIWLAGVSGFLMGSIWGSFINLCIDRWQIRYSKDQEAQISEHHFSEKLKHHLRLGTLSPLIPSRSFCFSCGHQLRFLELIPLVSFLLLKGRCRICAEAYGIRSFWVELTHGLFFGSLFVWLERWPVLIILALDFSLLWLLGSCYHYPKLGMHLKIAAFIWICLNPIVFLI